MSGITCQRCGQPATYRYPSRSWSVFDRYGHGRKEYGDDLYVCDVHYALCERTPGAIPNGTSPIAVPLKGEAS